MCGAFGCSIQNISKHFYLFLHPFQYLSSFICFFISSFPSSCLPIFFLNDRVACFPPKSITTYHFSRASVAFFHCSVNNFDTTKIDLHPQSLWESARTQEERFYSSLLPSVHPFNYPSVHPAMHPIFRLCFHVCFYFFYSSIHLSLTITLKFIPCSQEISFS